MHPSQLRLGDIICFHTTDEVPLHVAMYTCNINNNPYITHAINTGDTGVHTTILKRTANMHVFRPVNAELGALAAKRMLQWAQYRIPYDFRRAKWMEAISEFLIRDGNRKNIKQPIDHLLKVLIAEAHVKFYERIKFAARRDTCPVKMREGEQSRGFSCVQSVILAYQIEELAPYVKTLGELKKELEPLAETEEQLNEIWISDKHCTEDILENYILPESYLKYSYALRDKEELADFCFNNKRETPSHPHYYPSIVAINSELVPDIDKFIEKFESCLNLPAKFCFTDSLFAYMKRNPNHWENMGNLDYKTLPIIFSPEAKAEHRKRASDLDSTVLNLQQHIVRERAISNSSSPRSRAVSPYLCLDSYKAEFATTEFERDGFIDFSQLYETSYATDEQEEQLLPKNKSPLLDKRYIKKF